MSARRNRNRSHAGGGGGAHEWGTERHEEGQDTYFPTTAAGDRNTFGSNVGRDHPSASTWRGGFPGNTAQQQQGALESTITGSWRRAGGAHFGEMDRIGEDSGRSGGRRAAAGAEGAGSGLVWPLNRGALPAAAAAAAGVHRSREKQS